MYQHILHVLTACICYIESMIQLKLSTVRNNKNTMDLPQYLQLGSVLHLQKKIWKRTFIYSLVRKTNHKNLLSYIDWYFFLECFILPGFSLHMYIELIIKPILFSTLTLKTFLYKIKWYLSSKMVRKILCMPHVNENVCPHFQGISRLCRQVNLLNFLR